MDEAKLTCGAEALRRIEPYRPEIARNHELPGHFGRLISTWDNPTFVRAEAADRMRDDDYVFGLVYKGVARAYPLWVVDHYHVINDVIAGDPIVVGSCDACQTGTAYVSTVVNDKPTKFAVAGMYNATFLMTDRSGMFERKGSLWLHYEGAAYFGRLTGTFLPFVPTFHMTWRDWKTMHPDTDVMAAPEDRHHRDLRHGHGRGEYFARPGVNPAFIPVLSGWLDDRYPENELVLGLNVDQGIKAYPLKDVKLSDSVVHDSLGTHPIVVFAGPRPEQFTMAAYSRLVDGRTLSFRHQGTHFVDEQTHTTWTIEGVGGQGPLAGRSLTPVRWSYLRWHAWFLSHRSTELYRHAGALPIYPDGMATWEAIPAAFQPVLDAFVKLGRQTSIEGCVVTLALPHEVERGLRLWVGTDRLNLYEFRSREAAEDYVAFEGAWCCVPDGPKKVGRKRSLRVGSVVLESDPERQYADLSQLIRLPDAEICWSDLVTDATLVERWTAGLAEGDGPLDITMSGLVTYLRGRGYDIVDVSFLPHGQLRVGTVNVMTATIRSEPFVIYTCDDEATAEQVRSECPHAFCVGRRVFRPIPVDMYGDPPGELDERPDEEIRWGKLVDNERFVAVIKTYLEAPVEALQPSQQSS